jgi:hypothetical protein
MTKKQDKRYMYTIGHYFRGKGGAVGSCPYSDTFYCTLEEAKRHLKEIQKRDAEQEKADRHNWRIFQLVEVTQ